MPAWTEPRTTDAGHVSGINVDLVPGKRIVQAWRHQDFPEGVYSMAAFELGGDDMTSQRGQKSGGYPFAEGRLAGLRSRSLT